MKEIYFVNDCETLAIVPGFGSMLTLGCVVVGQGGVELVEGTQEWFYVRLSYDFNTEGFDKPTLDWWEKTRSESPEGAAAYQEAFHAQPRVSGKIGMAAYASFVNEVLRANKNEDGSVPKAVFVARPAGFDRGWVNYYLAKFLPNIGEALFNKHSLDIKSFEFGLGLDLGPEHAVFEAFTDIDSTEFDKSIGIDPKAHTHNALDDARHLAEVLRFLLSGPSAPVTFYDSSQIAPEEIERIKGATPGSLVPVSGGTFLGITRSTEIPTQGASVPISLEVLKKGVEAIAAGLGE